MLRTLRIEEIKYLAHRLAIDTMNWNEPIPEFETRYPHVLESCIATPFQKFERKSLYTGISGKGAILFYLLIKNHPFQNGNKRLAVTSLLVFLYKNNKWLKVSGKELYNLAVWVAESPAFAKNQMIDSIDTFIKKYLEIFPTK
jgi:death-on-curing family protein